MPMSTDAARTALVTLDGIGLRFGAEPVLTDVNLALEPGRIVTLIGPNGSGKTTLVRLTLGLLQPGTGRVWRKPSLRIGYVPQRVDLDDTFPLTVARYLKLARQVDGAAIGKALSEVGAAHVADRPLQRLSGGELRRVLLARALLGKPDLLVLDEPAAGVDVTGQTELYDLIRRTRDRLGCGVLLVSHDLHLVMAATDEVICLNHHICCRGAPEAVSRHPEYLSLFGAEAAGAFALYHHSHDHRHDPAGHVVDAHVVDDRGRAPDHPHHGHNHG